MKYSVRPGPQANHHGNDGDTATRVYVIYYLVKLLGMRVVIAILWFDKIIGVIILALSSRNRSLGIHQLAVWVVCATMQGGRNNFWNIARAYTWSVKRVVLQYSTVLRAGCLEHHLPSIVGMRVQPLP